MKTLRTQEGTLRYLWQHQKIIGDQAKTVIQTHFEVCKLIYKEMVSRCSVQASSQLKTYSHNVFSRTAAYTAETGIISCGDVNTASVLLTVYVQIAYNTKCLCKYHT